MSRELLTSVGCSVGFEVAIFESLLADLESHVSLVSSFFSSVFTASLFALSASSLVLLSSDLLLEV